MQPLRGPSRPNDVHRAPAPKQTGSVGIPVRGDRRAPQDVQNQPAGDRAPSLCRHKCHLSWRAVGTDVSITCNQFRRNHHAERDGSSEKTLTAQGEETVRNTIAKIRIPNSALMVTIAAMAERDELSQQWPHA